MPRIAKSYVRIVDGFNYFVGRIMMYSIFFLIAVLMYSIIAKQAFLIPPFWTLEVAQFTLVAYYLLGGAYSIQLGANVRMDLFYSQWSDRKKAWVDSITVLLLMFYLGVMLFGGIESLLYSIKYNQHSASMWRPQIWPIKAIMCVGIFMMLLQAISELIKDIATLRGEQL
ncbi:TRAP transporter small permease subunit [Profundibacter amoris]|uniref:TRAP transporter small permease protein n=1 Tax=Profundibacter amoris TaxID=2171755 RepID=A0A347UEA4_9RHOB|nr:TRAP transporter small permease subunit [Profundibacter amoris]AXX97182.1 TRAP transporter small permease subunit [Profundibacter amoris]